MATKKKVKANSKVTKLKKKIKPILKKVTKPVVKKKNVVKSAKIKPIAKPTSGSLKKKIAAKKSIKLTVKPIAKVSISPVVSAKPAPRRQANSEKQSAKSKAAAKSRQIVSTISLAERRSARMVRSNQTFAYMKAPGIEHAFDVGGTVEVFCDHEKNRERIRGWVKGIVVQVDHKMVAVQFRSNVYLTDGWMVPDRILWYPLTSDQIRSPDLKKINKKEIPDF